MAIGLNGSWWNSTERLFHGYNGYMNFNNTYAGRDPIDFGYGSSVRCLSD